MSPTNLSAPSRFASTKKQASSNQGLIATVGPGKSQKWQLTDDADFKAPDSRTSRDAQAIVQKFGKRQLNSLIDYVYDGYPKYT